MTTLCKSISIESIHVNPWLPNAAKQQVLASKDFSLSVSSKLPASPCPEGQIQAPAQSKSARWNYKFNVIKRYKKMLNARDASHLVKSRNGSHLPSGLGSGSLVICSKLSHDSWLSIFPNIGSVRVEHTQKENLHSWPPVSKTLEVQSYRKCFCLHELALILSAAMSNLGDRFLVARSNTFWWALSTVWICLVLFVVTKGTLARIQKLHKHARMVRGVQCPAW